MDSLNIEITHITPNDALEVKQLFRDVWAATYPNEKEGITFDDVNEFFSVQLSSENVEKFKQKLQTLSVNHHYFVARVEEKIVGVCEILIEDTENKLNIICTLPEYQGKGIGYALWKKAYETMDHTKPVTLFVVRYSIDAINFYKRLGFIEEGSVLTGEEFVLPSGTVLPEIRMILPS